MRTFAATDRSAAFAVEVRFSFVRKISAALNHHRSGQYRSGSRCNLAFPGHRRRRALPAAHLGALLFQNRLTRQTDAIAFHRQHLHQHLIAFFQLIADIGNSMLRHFANVQQSIGPRNDLDECAKIRQPGNLA